MIAVEIIIIEIKARIAIIITHIIIMIIMKGPRHGHTDADGGRLVHRQERRSAAAGPLQSIIQASERHPRSHAELAGCASGSGPPDA